MQMTWYSRFGRSWPFKALMILLALACMPMLWSAMDSGVIAPSRFLSSWGWMIKDFFGKPFFIPIIVYGFALYSIVLWWRRPHWATALLLIFALAVVCGAPGQAALTLLFWRN